jgi:hypothetical protein
MTERFMANCDNAGSMKRIIAVLIALLALSLLIPTILGMKPMLVGSPKNMTISDSPRYVGDPNVMALYATPSLAAFANNSWNPGVNANLTQGSQFNPYNIYYSQMGAQEAPGSIISFMANNTTQVAIPTPIPIANYSPMPTFRKHQLN